jgi:hypothetical protein
LPDRGQLRHRGAAMRQVLEIKGIWRVLSDTGDANSACRAYKAVKC